MASTALNPRRTVLKGLAAPVAAVAAASLALPALAEEDRSPVTLLVGAASSMDFTARLLADYLREALDRPVIAVSKLGAGGRLALGELKRSAPDGRTLMLSTSSAFTIFPNIYTNLEYDPVVDFTPIAGISWFDVGLAVGHHVPARTMGGLVDWARRQPGEIVYAAAPGTGSASHFAGIAVQQATQLPLTPVPYKDSGQSIVDLIGARLPIVITGTSPLVAQHRAGKILLLATSGLARSPLVPEVPTLKESGVDASIVVSASLYGPAHLPARVTNRLTDALEPFFARTDLRAKLEQQGMAPMAMGAAELAETLARERRQFAALAKASGYVPVPA